MVQQQTVEAHGQILEGVLTLATREMADVLGSLSGESPRDALAVLLDAAPQVIDPYAQVMTDLGATFYEQIREESGVDVPYTAGTIELPAPSRYESLVRWSVSPLFDQAATTTALMMLSGGMQRMLMDMSRDTIIGNGSIDRVQVGYQRVPKAGACAFCAMLASRSAVYSSQEAAEGVVGRGMPIPKVKRRGRQAGGIKTRGTRAVGEAYHDACKCKGVPVFKDNWVEMQSDADKYLDAYAEARNKVSEYRQTQGYIGYGDQATSQKLILAEMRQALGTH